MMFWWFAVGMLLPLVYLVIRWLAGSDRRRREMAETVFDAIRALNARGVTPTSYQIALEIGPSLHHLVPIGSVLLAVADLMAAGRISRTEVAHVPRGEHDPPRRWVYRIVQRPT
jgi:hypothetical protein